MQPEATVIQASIRGAKDEGIPNQDYIAQLEDDRILIATVSDGLGSSNNSHAGAELACRNVINQLQKCLDSSEYQSLGHLLPETWYSHVIQLNGPISSFRTANSFVAVMKREGKIVTGQLGDVLISLRVDGSSQLLPSTQKDFSNETECLGSGKPEEYQISIFDFKLSYDFLIATDGIADDLQPDKLDAFHEYLKAKYKQIDPSQRNHILMHEVENALSPLNNDDKSMIFVWTAQQL
jgi:serine/threonine protein phosphatase PrpC